jgi:hypothetical protein
MPSRRAGVPAYLIDFCMHLSACFSALNVSLSCSTISSRTSSSICWLLLELRLLLRTNCAREALELVSNLTGAPELPGRRCANMDVIACYSAGMSPAPKSAPVVGLLPRVRHRAEGDLFFLCLIFPLSLTLVEPSPPEQPSTRLVSAEGCAEPRLVALRQHPATLAVAVYRVGGTMLLCNKPSLQGFGASSASPVGR